eukprot:s2299_g18.t1
MRSGNLYEGACALDFPDATWSHQCFECEEDAVQKDVGAAVDDGGVGVAVAVSLDVGGILLQRVILARTCSCCHGGNARTGHWSSGHVRDRDGRWNWDHVCRVLLQHATQARKSFRDFGGF